MARTMLIVWAAAVLASAGIAADFRAGYGREPITPKAEGTLLAGAFTRRPSRGVHDPLYACAVAFDDGVRRAAVVTLDLCQAERANTDAIRALLARDCALEPASVYIQALHTHSGPLTRPVTNAAPYFAEDSRDIEAYIRTVLVPGAAKAVKAALADLAPAELELGATECRGLAFIRRFRMKDGRYLFIPPLNRPEDIAEAADRPDETEQVARFRRKGRPDIAIIHFANHACCVAGGNLISADWPGCLRDAFERKTGGAAKCLAMQGAEGDVNHLDYFPQPGDWAYEHKVPGGFDYIAWAGEKLADAALAIWDGLEKADAGKIAWRERTIRVKTNKPSPDELPAAREIVRLYSEKGFQAISDDGIGRSAKVADAKRKLRLADADTTCPLDIECLAIGKSLAFAGIPGEPFTAIGRKIKANSPFSRTFVTALTGGASGYLPDAKAYEHPTYEVYSASYASTLEADLTAGVAGLLEELQQPVK